MRRECIGTWHIRKNRGLIQVCTPCFGTCFKSVLCFLCADVTLRKNGRGGHEEAKFTSTLVMLVGGEPLCLDKSKKACQIEFHLGWPELCPISEPITVSWRDLGLPHVLRSLAYLWANGGLTSTRTIFIENRVKEFPTATQAWLPCQMWGMDGDNL